MEQVFDFREFVIKIWKKFKLAVVLGLILALLGGVFGFLTFPKKDEIKAISTAAVSMADRTKDGTALTNTMSMINSVVTGDNFYISVLQNLSTTLNKTRVVSLFDGDESPKIKKLKEVIILSVRGNIVSVEVISGDKQLSNDAVTICMDYIIKQIPIFNDDVSVKPLQQQTINITKQNNDSVIKKMLLYTALGMGGGIVIAIMFIFFVDIIDLKVRCAADLKRYKLPILGEIRR